MLLEGGAGSLVGGLEGRRGPDPGALATIRVGNLRMPDPLAVTCKGQGTRECEARMDGIGKLAH